MTQARLYKTFLAAVKAGNKQLIINVASTTDVPFLITLMDMPNSIRWMLCDQHQNTDIEMEYIYHNKQLMLPNNDYIMVKDEYLKAHEDTISLIKFIVPPFTNATIPPIKAALPTKSNKKP